jgi:hypothetical protein
MSTDPLRFVAERLSDLKGLMDGAGVDPGETIDQDALELRAAVPEVLETVRNLLAQVREGHLAKGPEGIERAENVRMGWL